METKGTYDINNKPNTTPLSKKDEVRNALAHLKAKGIKDWEILNIWSEIIYEQGNYAIADTLASAAYELGKPVE